MSRTRHQVAKWPLRFRTTAEAWSLAEALRTGSPASRKTILFLAGLTLWTAARSLVAVLLRNFASYAASLVGYAATTIARDLLGTVGGLDANAAFLLALTRASEICLGIVCAGVVLAGTDLGGAPRRLAALFAELTRGIGSGLVGTLAEAREEPRETRGVQRDFLRRAIALDSNFVTAIATVRRGCGLPMQGLVCGGYVSLIRTACRYDAGCGRRFAI